jgi:hypothetical protein
VKKADKAIQDIKDSFKGSFTVELKVSQESTDKLYYLQHQERDIIAVTQQMVDRMVKEYVTSIEENPKFVDQPELVQEQAMEAAAEECKQVILERFENKPKDVNLRKLSKDYIKQKGNSKVGVNSGELYRDIRSAKVMVKRTK